MLLKGNITTQDGKTLKKERRLSVPGWLYSWLEARKVNWEHI